jgi:hypothetical protein
VRFGARRTELSDQDRAVAALKAETAWDAVLSQKLGRHLDGKNDLKRIGEWISSALGAYSASSPSDTH